MQVEFEVFFFVKVRSINNSRVLYFSWFLRFQEKGDSERRFPEVKDLRRSYIIYNKYYNNGLIELSGYLFLIANPLSCGAIPPSPALPHPYSETPFDLFFGPFELGGEHENRNDTKI